MVESAVRRSDEPPAAICVFDPDFHEGVVGIVASRLKDRLHRPTFVFASQAACGQDGTLKGSGRSIDRAFTCAMRSTSCSKRPPGRAAALRRPRDGGRLHDRTLSLTVPHIQVGEWAHIGGFPRGTRPEIRRLIHGIRSSQ
jgi:hypothetical protein